YREELPTKGETIIRGIKTSKMKNRNIPYLRRTIGVVFQDFKLLPKMTVYENIAFALEVIEEQPRNIRTRVMYVLELVNLKHKARSLPHELSGGEYQPLSIARTIENQPHILIDDELTVNFDTETSWSIMLLLEEVNARGTTIIMATHSKEIVNTMN